MSGRHLGQQAGAAAGSPPCFRMGSSGAGGEGERRAPMKPAGYVLSVRGLPSTLIRRCIRTYLTSFVLRAYFSRLRSRMIRGRHSRSLWGPVDGRGAHTPPSLSSIQCRGAFSRLRWRFGPRAMLLRQGALRSQSTSRAELSVGKRPKQNSCGEEVEVNLVERRVGLPEMKSHSHKNLVRQTCGKKLVDVFAPHSWRVRAHPGRARAPRRSPRGARRTRSAKQPRKPKRSSKKRPTARRVKPRRR